MLDLVLNTTYVRGDDLVSLVSAVTEHIQYMNLVSL